MRKILMTACISLLAFAAPMSARADAVGAAAGAGTGLIVAGPPGAIVGGVVGAVFGKPYWGPADRRSCWIDNRFHRHCPHSRWHW